MRMPLLATRYPQPLFDDLQEQAEKHNVSIARMVRVLVADSLIKLKNGKMPEVSKRLTDPYLNV